MMLEILKISDFLTLIIASIVMLFIIYFIIKRINKKKIQSNIAQIKKSVVHSVTEPSITILKKKSNYEIPDVHKENQRPKINIKKKSTPENLKGVSVEFFNNLINSSAFLNFDMSELWQNSVLSDIYMSVECCNRLDAYLKKENLEQIQFEANMIPEIGGILLGRFNEERPSSFRITLEEFIAIESVNPNLYTLEFCTDSLVKELGDAADTHPALSVVGWFHTHPGHGLFLSIPDLTIQMGFFRESYQIAMEIDSLSSQLDTGFFTQKTSGIMNNSIDNRPAWYSWKAIIDAIS